MLSKVIRMAQSKGRFWRLTESDPQPVPFANVFLLGTSIGGSTDFDGNFQFNAAPGEYKLVVSSLGYQADTLSIVLEAGSVF